MTSWHLFKKGSSGIMFWLGEIEADDASSAVGIFAHDLRKSGELDTTIPSGREALIHAVPADSFYEVEAGWFHDPPQLHVNTVGGRDAQRVA